MMLQVDSDLDTDAINTEVKPANKHAKQDIVEELDSLTTENCQYIFQDLKEKTEIAAIGVQKV